MIGAAWLVPALPFAAALVGFLLPQQRRIAAAVLAVGGTAASTALAGVLLAQVLPHAARHGETSAALAPFGAITVTVGTRSDGLACVIAVMVCVVALLVQAYSTAYLADDGRYPRYAAEVSLFTAAMLLVVLAGDLLELYAGWEVMGICSYLLIGHYRELPEAPAAAVKAFVVTRVGDVGFLLAVLVLGLSTGSFRIARILGTAGSMPHPALLAATLLLLAGVAGKSAQFPLHTWLPDAMAGPTPISALIHAATMVAAGAYVVARLYPLFAAAPAALAVLGIVAAVTMLLGALSALGQDDLKRVLAWSTVSQLAYITGALAVGGVTAGMFHLLTHAAFKALLFLGAGAVLHATGEQLMSRMGGLWRRLPLTFATMVIGGAALAGLPPLAGAFSKDSVLAAALECARGHGPAPAWVGWLVYVTGLVTAFVTSAYVTRMLLLTFLGRRRTAGPIHAVPPAMSLPLVVLALPAVLLGAVAGVIGRWMPPLVPGTGAVHIGIPALGLSTVLVVAGFAIVTALWWRPRADPLRLVAPVVPWLRSGFRLDSLQDVLVVRPYRAFAAAVLGFDTRIVDGAVRSSGSGARRTGRLLSLLQTGNVALYLSGVVAGSVVLAVVMAIVFPLAVFK